MEDKRDVEQMAPQPRKSLVLIITAIAAGLATGITAFDVGGQIYKCTDTNGAITYQQGQCANQSGQKTLQDQRSQRIDPKLCKKDRAMILLLLSKGQCDDQVPGFRRGIADDYSRWRIANNTAVLCTENDPEYMALRRQSDHFLPPTRGQLEKTCDGLAQRFAKERGPAGKSSDTAER